MNAKRSLLMPKLGLTMNEGLLAEWRIAAGDSFAGGDILFVVETDKIASEVAAEADGRLVEILVPAGQAAAVGAELATVEHADGTAADRSPAPMKACKVEPAEDRAREKQANAGGAGQPQDERVVATPFARRLARLHGVNLSRVIGSGPRGRIKAADIERMRRHSPAPRTDSAQSADRSAVAEPEQARHAAGANRDIPRLYFTAKANVDALEDLRHRANASDGWPKTTVTHWITAAVGRTLADTPEANRIWIDGAAHQLAGSHVGVVSWRGGGVFISVAEDAGHRSVGALSRFLDTAGEAGVNTAGPGVTSISLFNPEMDRIESAAPVIDAAQSMALGVGCISPQWQPAGAAGFAEVKTMTLTLACDHRVHNGILAARFLTHIVDYVENPMRLLMPPPLQ